MEVERPTAKAMLRIRMAPEAKRWYEMEAIRRSNEIAPLVVTTSDVVREALENYRKAR